MAQVGPAMGPPIGQHTAVPHAVAEGLGLTKLAKALAPHPELGVIAPKLFRYRFRLPKGYRNFTGHSNAQVPRTWAHQIGAIVSATCTNTQPTTR